MLRELRNQVRQRPLLRTCLECACEVALTVAFLKAYNWTRNKFGSSQDGSLAVALQHGEDIVAMERVLGLYWEEQIQAAGISLGAQWIRFWNIFYGSAHMAVTVFVLLFLFALRPAAYQARRTEFMLMNLVAIIGYATYPLMPPRLLNACDAYGGCVKSYGYVDTMHVYGGLWSWKQKGVSSVSNHYAAMPSMHAGYSIWCVWSLRSRVHAHVCASGTELWWYDGPVSCQHQMARIHA